MPVLEVQDPQGRTLEIEGDHTPSESELTDIFSKAFPAEQPIIPVRRPETGPAASSMGLVMGAQPTLSAPPPAMPQMAQTGEAKQAALESLPQISGEQAEQIATTPNVSLPRLNDPEMPVTSAMVNVGEGLIEQALLTPASGAMLTAFKIPGVREAFAAVLGAAAVKAGSQKVGEASVTGNPQQMAEGAILGGLGVAGAAGLLPRSAEAVKKLPKTGEPEALIPKSEGTLVNEGKPLTPESEVTNASQIQTSTEVHGDVQPQPERGVGEVPGVQGSERIQPQAERGIQAQETPVETKPAPPSTEQAPETQAPTEPAVRTGEEPGAQPPGSAPAIPESTAQGPESQISVGPGAASPGDIPSESTAAQLTQALKGISNSKPIREQFSLADKAADVLSFGKAVWQGAVNRAQAAAHITSQILKGKTHLDTLDKMVYEAEAAKSKAAGNARNIRMASLKAFKSPLERTAMNDWLAAQAFDNPVATLQKWAADARAHQAGAEGLVDRVRLKRIADSYEAALRLNRNEVTAARQVEQFYRSVGEQLQNEGVLKNLLEDYMGPHMVDSSNPALNSFRADLEVGKLSTNFRYAMRRVFETEADLEASGRKTVTKDIFAKLTHYLQAAENAKANRNLVKNLKEGATESGDPWVDFRVSRIIPKTETGEPGAAVLIKPNKNPGNPSDYVKFDHPALRGWRWAAKDDQGRPVFVEADAWLHGDIADRFRNYVERSKLYRLPGVETATKIQQEVKGSKFSMSLFHPVQLAIHKLFHLDNPFDLSPVDPNSPRVNEWMKSGLRLYEREGLEQFTQGIAAGRWIQRVPVLGKLARMSNELTWDHLFPSFKVGIAEKILEHNKQRYSQDPTGFRGAATKLMRMVPGFKELRPVLSNEDLMTISANQANFAMGGHPWRAMGMAPELNHALHLAFRAPDFLASRIGFITRAATKLGAEERMALAVGTASLYTLSRMANLAFSGNPHNEDPFAIFIGNRRYTLRSVMGDAVNFVKEPVRWWRHRLSPSLAVGLEAMSKTDAFGHYVTYAGVAKDIAYEALPIPITPRSDVRWYESLVDSMGLHTSRYSPTTRMRGVAADWKKAQGIPASEGIYPMPENTLSGQARMALESGDQGKFEKAISQLVEQQRATGDSMPHRTVESNFKRYYHAPLVGNARRERLFRESLSPEDRKTYEESQDEREALWRKFKQWF